MKMRKILRLDQEFEKLESILKKRIQYEHKREDTIKK